MELTEFTIRVIFLFLPGIIANIVLQYLTVGRNSQPFYFVLYSLVLGPISYLGYAFIVKLLILLNVPMGKMESQFLTLLFSTGGVPDPQELFWVSITAVVVGAVIALIINRKFLMPLAQRIGITNKFAEVDVWDYIFNSGSPMEWVTVRDIKNGLVYTGWVEAFSDSHRYPRLKPGFFWLTPSASRFCYNS